MRSKIFLLNDRHQTANTKFLLLHLVYVIYVMYVYKTEVLCYGRLHTIRSPKTRWSAEELQLHVLHSSEYWMRWIPLWLWHREPHPGNRWNIFHWKNLFVIYNGFATMKVIFAFKFSLDENSETFKIGI